MPPTQEGITPDDLAVLIDELDEALALLDELPGKIRYVRDVLEERARAMTRPR